MEIYKIKKLSKSISEVFLPKSKRSATRLTHKNLYFQEDISVKDTTGVVDMFNSSNQKVYFKELDFYGLDFDNPPNLVNGLGGNCVLPPSPSKK